MKPYLTQNDPPEFESKLRFPKKQTHSSKSWIPNVTLTFNQTNKNNSSKQTKNEGLACIKIQLWRRCEEMEIRGKETNLRLSPTAALSTNPGRHSPLQLPSSVFVFWMMMSIARCTFLLWFIVFFEYYVWSSYENCFRFSLGFLKNVWCSLFSF